MAPTSGSEDANNRVGGRHLLNHPISHENRVKAIVLSAWRRCLLLLAFEQLAFVLAIVFGGGILMLLLGTQILDWYWLTMLAVTAVAVSIIRLRHRIVTQYRVAQVVDRRLRLNDSLSTAWFLLSSLNQLDDAVSRFQIEQAERTAASINLTDVFPFRRQVKEQRVWAVAGALGVAMFGLFAVRYLVHSTLSLEESLIPIHLGSVFERIEHSLSAENHLAAYPGEAEDEPNSTKPTQPDRNYETSEALRSRDPDLERQPDPSNGDQSTTRERAAEENQRAQNGQSEKSAVREGQQRNPGGRTEENREQTNTLASHTNKDATDRQSASSGLLEKMKDAVSSLLDKMKSSQNSNRAAQNSERTAEGSRTEQQSAAKNEQQGQSPNTGTERARNDSGSEGGERGKPEKRPKRHRGEALISHRTRTVPIRIQASDVKMATNG